MSAKINKMWGIICFCKTAHAYTYPLFLSSLLSQDGKTAEDLAYADQHELIVALLGKLKKVKSHMQCEKLSQ